MTRHLLLRIVTTGPTTPHRPRQVRRHRATSAALGVSIALALLFAPSSSAVAEVSSEAGQAAARIDRFLVEHWQRCEVAPAPRCDDATFLRRVTLDLAGRIPTTGELDRFLKDTHADKRAVRIRELIEGPEFALHFGNVLDQWIQQDHQGDEKFVDYLRIGLRERKPWDRMFREIMLGPWDDDSLKPANRFLDKRAKTLDTLTTDTARVFFGVDISCAKCHDHPLVDDWSQEHFYGMAAFLNRTTGGKGKVGEKDSGEVTFLAEDGEEKTARMMFLSGYVVESPGGSEASGRANEAGGANEAGNEATPAAVLAISSRREQLVAIALEERRFFSRAFVNRVWQAMFGRGLVEPVDQMHAANTPAIPELLDWLATRFVDSGYDVHLLVESIALTEAYQLSSRWESEAALPEPEAFAVARLRPLGRKPLAFSLLLAAGDGSFGRPPDADERRAERLLGSDDLRRVTRYLAVEHAAEPLAGAFDPVDGSFQSSAREALFMSNADVFQQVIEAAEGNLADRLAERDAPTDELVREACRATLGRPAESEELERLVEWFKRQEQPRARTCEQLIWALVTSAEFRFNH